MEKELLHNLVELGLSTNGIAKELNMSQTNVRHWLRKHGLNTKYTLRLDSKMRNGKKCVRCDQDLTGKQSKFCSKKCKAKTHTYYQGNTNGRQKRVSRERKLKLIEMSGGSCEECGYRKNLAALSFHHIDPENKAFCLDARKLSNTRWDSIVAEWEKCQLLCLNCHAENHNPELNTS